MSGSRSLSLRTLAATLISAAAAALIGLPGCGDDDPDFADPPSYDSRLVLARGYINPGAISTQHGAKSPFAGQKLEWTLPGESAASVGHTLARLRPTWVSGLMRLEEGEKITSHQAAVYSKIRRIVRQTVPDAQFDIELDSEDYKSAAQVRETMEQIRSKVHNDGWFFDFFTPVYAEHPEIIKAAVDEAHSHGQWIGGNAFGWHKHPPPIPPGADYLGAADVNFKLDLPGVRGMAEEIPVVFHLSNNPTNPKSEGCIWINSKTTSQRESYISERARQQQKWHFTTAYPVFFPSCQRGNEGNDPRIVSYNAAKDGTMLQTVKRLLDKYNE